MVMEKYNLENLDEFIINTGNILSINDITKKPNQNPSEELVDAVNCTIKEFQTSDTSQPQSDHLLIVNRQNDNLKISEHELSDLKIGFKVFLNNDNQESFTEAIQKALMILNVNSIDDLIISFKHKQSEDKKDDLSQIQTVWKILESFVSEEKIKQIGIADIEENTFRALHEWAQVKPTIIQINLASCCVVPPTLQTFCKENNIKLLTHSDPSDILPKSSGEGIFGKPLVLKWALRYLIHVKCRGVLTTKGYLLNFMKG
ncbi:glutamate-cysteine ligase modifier subunit isoform X2 [Leptinotarsa decemlineata]|uniref:glutamate-cysteine ligase modifier subunit isoform X2 n=1 Tax=Leptinotarsa decemlineata TaxID=7539 RepID=UPI003D30B869